MINSNTHQLLIEKLNKTVNETDEVYINKLIEEDDDVRNYWINLQTFYIDAKQSISNANETVAWNSIRNKLSKQQSKTIQFKSSLIWVTAACVLIAFATILFFSGNHNEIKNQPTAAIKKSSTLSKLQNVPANQIQLKLANGENVNLSNSYSKTITTASANISATQHALSFNTINNQNVEWNTLQVPVALDYKITLADGTEVWLNSISQLRFPFSFPGDTREIYISGEAYLKVAKNALKPFIVHTGETDIVVHGTIFNVNTYTQYKTVVSLVEGAVTAFKKNNDSLQLKPGFEAAIFQNNKSTLQNFNIENITAWMSGVQYFHETSLNNIAQIIYRWFNTKVIFDNPLTAAYTFSGVINKNKPLADFLNNLKTSSGISFNYNNGDLHIK